MTISQSLVLPSPVYPSTLHEIDVELYAFIERYATNLPRWDLLLFFGQNPTLSSDVVDIAERVGRTTNTVQKELDNLTYLGILQADRSVRRTHYTLSRSLSIRRAVLRMARELSPRN
jgi:DNA-binding MarR family transcriptional regulator